MDDQWQISVKRHYTKQELILFKNISVKEIKANYLRLEEVSSICDTGFES